MSKRINKFFFWLFLHTPERLKRFYPDSVRERIAEATKKEIELLQSEITRLRWQKLAADRKLKEVKNVHNDNKK